MRKFNLLTVLTIIIMVCTFTVQIGANSVQDLDHAASKSWSDTVVETVKSYKNGNIIIKYTSDSVLQNGVSAESMVDILAEQVYLNITVEAPMGYVVYDDASTDYIDGIRVNGETVTAYKIPIDYTQDIDYTIDVKFCYAEGFTGALAQMSDGTYDWTKLLENPVGLLMALYYVLATVSVVVGIFAMWTGKNKKVKSTSEISKSVTDTAHETSIKIIEEQVLPIVTSFQITAQSLVKAFALTTSKSEEAPLALLSVLQTVSNTDAEAAIQRAKELIIADRAAAEAARQQTIDTLNNIAQASQEVESNENEPTEAEEEDVAIF